MTVEGGVQGQVISSDSIVTGHDDEITAIQNSAIPAKHFPDQTLQTISVHCPSGLLT